MKTAMDAVQLTMFVEGAPAKEETLKDWVELRINGPRWHGSTKDEWQANLEINIFVLSKMDHRRGHRLLDNIGIVTVAMVGTIPVFKLGDGADDDQSFITCLMLKNEGKESLRVNQLGQVTPSTQMLRATVEGSYFGNFQG